MKSGLIRIHNKTISDDSPVFIIAEAGVNHNGSLANAKKLIDVAKKCGADCVKFQTYVTDDIVTQTADKAPYQKASGYDETQWEMLKRLELSYEQFSDLMDYANRSEIIFMSTPYGIGDLEFLISINVPAIKIASALVVETHLLKKAASSGLPVILSTGMCSASEVESAVTAFKEENNDQIVVLQCTSNYPSKLENANLKAMKYMRNAFDVLVGYSDHTESSVSAVAAVALGATVIERHQVFVIFINAL
jgi:N,N'-diacetyllegionaminate synthase